MKVFTKEIGDEEQKKQRALEIAQIYNQHQQQVYSSSTIHTFLPIFAKREVFGLLSKKYGITKMYEFSNPDSKPRQDNSKVTVLGKLRRMYDYAMRLLSTDTERQKVYLR